MASLAYPSSASPFCELVDSLVQAWPVYGKGAGDDAEPGVVLLVFLLSSPGIYCALGVVGAEMIWMDTFTRPEEVRSRTVLKAQGG